MQNVGLQGFKPSRTAFQSVSMRSIACILAVSVSEIVPFRFVDFDTFSTGFTGFYQPISGIQ